LQDPYESLASYYDLEHSEFTADIDFYLRLLDPGPVLELGTGTGRIAGPLAAAGFDVWGVDSSSAMLELAARHLAGQEHVHLVRAELPAMELNRTFSAAIIPLNVLWHLPDAGSQLESVRSVRRHLARGAILCVDTSNPHVLADRGSHGEVRMRFTRGHDGQRITCMSAAWDDEELQTIELELLYDVADQSGAVTRTQVHLDLRYLFREQLGSMLAKAGFEVRHVYGSYDLDPYENDSANLIVVGVAD
jgi:SAM-dependent methyltransferase